jgi:citrate lyase synthetase
LAELTLKQYYASGWNVEVSSLFIYNKASRRTFFSTYGYFYIFA